MLLLQPIIEGDNVIAVAERLVQDGLERLDKEFSRALLRGSVETKADFWTWANGRVVLYVRELEELAGVIGCDVSDRDVLVVVQRELEQMLRFDGSYDADLLEGGEPLGDNRLTPVFAYLPKAVNGTEIGEEPGIILVNMLYK